ncbi:hsp70 nucleotide exchange factor fes1 [Puccinia graminis f. sp. tritici]|uniref:Hsp70 nucleotide exchange factor fes1 n=1 Tax=Puccinia graminis f. sp. tritici TaxID=56615 RepID=A0A5B0NQP5_PUCGR|nr:hsp70 nucleotide exchange factor fes1 [Puccinia graminis f. sp. tritici]KAA1090188.1 hsp70 nucleotide exchange factor fes1 [Puccinia graminis f. sp. tritici]
MDPKLNDLLHWAVENTNRPQAENQTRAASTAVAPVPSSDPIPLSITYNPHESSQVQAPTAPSKKLDTGVLDAILGRTDAVRMREAMGIFEDPNKPIQERCNAGEELEDLIQDLDNANDMEVLGFWPKLITLLESNPSGSDENDLIKFHTCWICGTAVQNNPKSQIAFLKRDPLPTILEILCHASEATQAKAMYCLSSTLKHAPEETQVMKKFSEAHGWEALHDCLRGPSMTLRRKTVFLINTLVLEESLDLEELRSAGLLNTLIASLSPSRAIPAGKDGELSSQDEDYVEKVLRTIATLLINSSARPNQVISDDEKNLVKEVLKELKLDSASFKQLVESSGIGESEWSQALESLGPFSLK